MGYMKSLVINRLDDDEEFRLAFELDEDSRIEPDWPDETESFTSFPTSTLRSHDHASPISF